MDVASPLSEVVSEMDVGSSLSEVVSFEVPGGAGAGELLAMLVPGRMAWLAPGDVVSIVGVLLDGDDFDLANVLRRVQSWAAARGLRAIPFALDGRTYVLQAAREGQA